MQLLRCPRPCVNVNAFYFVFLHSLTWERKSEFIRTKTTLKTKDNKHVMLQQRLDWEPLLTGHLSGLPSLHRCVLPKDSDKSTKTCDTPSNICFSCSWKLLVVSAPLTPTFLWYFLFIFFTCITHLHLHLHFIWGAKVKRFLAFDVVFNPLSEATKTTFWTDSAE